LVGEGESGSASTFFGPVRAGLTTSQATSKEAQLSELLSSLEREVENLRSKYCEAYVILISVMEHLVKLNSLLLNTDTTKEGEGV
jgi:molybdopterin converting factor small subunit